MRRITTALFLLISVVSLPLSAEDAFLGRTSDEWKKQLAGSEGSQRVYAAWAIAQSAGVNDALNKNGFESLKMLIQDRDPTVRYWGALGFQQFAKSSSASDTEKKNAIETLLPLLNDKSAAPRIAAAESLCLLGQTEKSVPVLVAAMDDPQDSVRIQAVAALEKIGPAAQPAIATLEKAISDPSEYVKRISERSLSGLGVESKQLGTKTKAKKGKAKAKSEA